MDFAALLSLFSHLTHGPIAHQCKSRHLAGTTPNCLSGVGEREFSGWIGSWKITRAGCESGDSSTQGAPKNAAPPPTHQSIFLHAPLNTASLLYTQIALPLHNTSRCLACHESLGALLSPSVSLVLRKNAR